MEGDVDKLSSMIADEGKPPCNDYVAQAGNDHLVVFVARE